MKPNPYQTSKIPDDESHSSEAHYSPGQWALMGSVMAAALPIAFGLLALRSELAYAVPRPPGVAKCGMGALAAFMMIVIGGPLFGAIGGVVGWLMGICAKRLG